jgi:hypothetical protein
MWAAFRTYPSGTVSLGLMLSKIGSTLEVEWSFGPWYGWISSAARSI